MRVQCDDELYRVDRVFLGPMGKPWPFRATYRAYVFWGLLTVSALLLWRMIGLPWHILVPLVLATLGYPTANWIDKKLTADRPIWSELERIVQELVAPRPDLNPADLSRVHKLRVQRWKAGAAPDNRWPARLWAWLGSVASRVGRRGGGRVYKDGEWSNVR